MARDGIRARDSTPEDHTYEEKKYSWEKEAIRYSKKFHKQFVEEHAFKRGDCLEVDEKLKRRGWNKMNSMIQDSSHSIAIEFLANTIYFLGKGRVWQSYVCGKVVLFDDNTINKILEVQAPEVCHVERLRVELEETKEVGPLKKIMDALCVPEVGLLKHVEGCFPRKKKIQKDMKPLEKAWGTYFVSNLKVVGVFWNLNWSSQ